MMLWRANDCQDGLGNVGWTREAVDAAFIADSSVPLATSLVQVLCSLNCIGFKIIKQKIYVLLRY